MKPETAAERIGKRERRLRRAAWLTLVACLVNIILPFASAVAAARLSSADGIRPWAETAICSAAKDQPPPANDHGGHGPLCPLCLLLGGQVLAPQPGTTTLAALPATIEPAPPSGQSSPAMSSPRRPQAARAPPVPV